MIFYVKYNFAFQHINRTGGTSVRRMIKGIAGDPDKGSAFGRVDHRSMKSALRAIGRRFPDIPITEMPIYVNVRNPFDRIVSIYFYRRKNGKYPHIHFRNYFYNMFMPGGRVVNEAQEAFCCVRGRFPDNVIVVKFEELSNRWKHIIEFHFGPQIDIFPKMNSTVHDDPMIYFDDKMIEKVLEKEKWVVENYYPELLDLL